MPFSCPGGPLLSRDLPLPSFGLVVVGKIAQCQSLVWACRSRWVFCWLGWLSLDCHTLEELQRCSQACLCRRSDYCTIRALQSICRDIALPWHLVGTWSVPSYDLNWCARTCHVLPWVMLDAKYVELHLILGRVAELFLKSLHEDIHMVTAPWRRLNESFPNTVLDL